ncbi:putative T7SS-secreted protein [Streptomyces sp. NPDC059828]|uniref:putative T7SS-secreted protein n=1 Tax=Streptomyces sp. NPDC059828 TaxID=3346965 RepID=UPI00365BB7C2
MSWRDFVPDSVEDAGKAVSSAAGEAVEWVGDKSADLVDGAGWEGGADWIREESRAAANYLGADVAELGLGQTEDPRKLVYGSVDKLRETATHLKKLQSSFDKVGEGLKGVGADGFQGEAATAFRKSSAQQPPKWFAAADTFETVAAALDSFAATVAWAQAQAKEAIEEYKVARRLSEDARTAHDQRVTAYADAVDAGKESLPPRPGDFKEPESAKETARAAQDKLDSARRQRDEAAESVTAVLRTAREAAPPEPSFKDRFKDGVLSHAINYNHFFGGVVKGTAGMLSFARSVDPSNPYNLLHPAEYLMNLNSTTAGLLTSLNNPVGTASTMIDDFMKDPAEGTGKLIPELAGTKGVTSPLKRFKDFADLAKRAPEAKKPGPARTELKEPDGQPDKSRNSKTDKVCDGDPVDMATGRMILPQTDVTLPGSLPLVFARTYESSYRAGRWFGPSWSCTIDQRLEIDSEGVVFVREDGSLLDYPHPAPGVPVLPRHGNRWLLERQQDGYTVTDPGTGHVRHFVEWPDGDTALLTQIDDRNGAWVSFEYTADGTPLSASHSGGYGLRFTSAGGRVTSLSLADGTRILDYRYTDGQLTEVVNSCGRPLLFGYDEHSRITSWTDTNGSHYDYVYDDRHRCVAQSGANGHLGSRFTYDDGVTTLTDAAGHERRYVVNDRLQITAETDATGATTHFERDAYNRLLSRTDPLGRTTRITYDDDGRVVSVARPDGRQSRVEYSGPGFPVKVTGADGRVTRQTFDERGNRTSVTDPSGATTRFAYDEHGHLASVTNALGHTSTVRCDRAGLPVEITDPLGGVTRYARDSFGRPIAVTDPLGAVTRLEWTVEGKLARRVEADGSEQSWTYDGEGNCVRRTDAMGGVSTYEYTDFDLLTARTGPDGVRYEFSHDMDLRLTRVTNPQGLTWDYTYDPAGRLKSESDFDDRTLTYAYDVAGRLTSRTNGLGETIRYEHDELDRIVRKDAEDAVTTYEYDVFGELAVAAAPDATLTRLRDRFGRLRSETVDGRELSFAYDALGRRTGRTTPGGAASTWAYDAAGRRTELTTSGRTLTFEHDAAGQELTRHIGETITLRHAFDPMGRLTEQHVVGADRSLQRRGYTYRADGNLTGIDEQLGGARTFDLDATGRVTAVHAANWSERYAYDAAGNQTEASWPTPHPGQEAVGTRTYTGTRITRAGNVRYEHDAQGRVTLRQKTRLSRKPDTWRYAWDAEDRLISVTTPDGTVWRYQYDALGRRTAKQRLAGDGQTVVEQVTFTWDGATLCEQTAEGPSLPHPVATTWDYRGLHPLAQTERLLSADTPQEAIDDRFFAIVTDLVGTPTELIDESGDLAWHTRSTLWGTTTWAKSSTAYTPLRFPGQYFDPETGLHYNYFRHYDPETARYLSADPLGLAPAPNSTAYVHNPHTRIDHLGLAPYRSGDSPMRNRGPDELNGPDVGAVLPGGRPDGELVFSGHGSWDPANGFTVIPEGTSITFYSPHGYGLNNRAALDVEQGANWDTIETVNEGKMVPNYTLSPAPELPRMSESIDVVGDMNLSDLLYPHMGPTHWAACRIGPSAWEN